MKNKNRQLLKESSIAGLKWSPDKSSVAVDWQELPASEHFFVATHFAIKDTPFGINLLFGAKSTFDESSKNFDWAVEIHIPAPEAYAAFYQNVFNEIGGNGSVTFYESISLAMKKRSEKESQSIHKAIGIGLPINRGSSFRLFASNFATIAFTGHQAIIEFFEISPDLLHLSKNGRQPRPGAGIKPVVSVIVDTMLLLSFLEECKAILPNIKMMGEQNEL